MVFMCQRDSFLTEFETQVVSCDKVCDAKELSTAGVTLDEGKPVSVFRVVLEDTILFPEGGGQPDDRGTINGNGTQVVGNVIRSIRKGTQAIHYVSVLIDDDNTTSPFNTGDKVTAKIDWKRRFDHMQQHSGQHLITAVADSLFGFQTTSWWLGSDESNIELDTKDITSDQLAQIEQTVNQKIRDCLPVTVDVVELTDPKLKSARGRNLPEDVKGQIRIVTMAGVESNVCCGTHVTNLGQLQVIKLLQVVKKKGKCLVTFLSGNRVLDRFSEIYDREQKLMGILKSSPAELTCQADKLNLALKNVRKSCLILSKDLAALEAKKYLEMENPPKFWSYHRDNVDLDFANALLRELGQPKKNQVLLITIKTEGNSGHMMLVGGGDLDKEKITNLGDSLCGVLDGKGNLRGNVYQAKVNKMNNVKKAVTLAEDIVATLVEENGPEK